MFKNSVLAAASFAAALGLANAAQAQDPNSAVFRDALMEATPQECNAMLDALTQAILTGGAPNEIAITRQIRTSVEYYCRASTVVEEITSLGFEPAPLPVVGGARSINQEAAASVAVSPQPETNPELADKLRVLNTERVSYVEGADIYLDFAIQADPDAANDLLRRLLGGDPLEKKVK